MTQNHQCVSNQKIQTASHLSRVNRPVEQAVFFYSRIEKRRSERKSGAFPFAPHGEYPHMDNPDVANPHMEKPHGENPAQINTK